MRYLYRIFAWIGIGFGYQIMSYGPDAWTSMLMVGHVLGWPLFLLAWLLSYSIWACGLIVGGIALLLAVAWLIDKKDEYRLRKRLNSYRRGRATP